MRRRTGAIAALIGGALALIAKLPLAWIAAPLPDVGARYSGTWWNGQANSVPLLGQLGVKGRLGSADLATPPGTVTLRGTVGLRAAQNVILNMPIERLPTTDARLAGLAGQFSLRLDEATYNASGCQSATGTASTNVLAANGARFAWTGPELSGPVDCVDGRVRVQLSGEADGTAVRSSTLTGMDGVYQTDTVVTTADPAAGNALVLFGFSRGTGEGGAAEFTLSEQGRWD